ncbi:MAG: hypothetical protein KAS94_10720 [Desulfobulbaceae bacterium]|nr:hypothetical protein [Desulfobulbaceae bacterium]
MAQTTNPRKLTIFLPAIHRQKIIDHCLRKLLGNYLEGEEHNLKAYGLLAGEKTSDRITIKACLPLLKNARSVDPHRGFMDEMMEKHAVASETPLAKRGWVADSTELSSAVAEFKRQGLALIGSYHMHRVAWDHDYVRDTPTTLDTILGRDSRLIMFIISVVKPDQPIIRAFFEGSNEQEIPICVID